MELIPPKQPAKKLVEDAAHIQYVDRNGGDHAAARARVRAGSEESPNTAGQGAG